MYASEIQCRKITEGVLKMQFTVSNMNKSFSGCSSTAGTFVRSVTTMDTAQWAVSILIVAC